MSFDMVGDFVDVVDGLQSVTWRRAGHDPVSLDQALRRDYKIHPFAEQGGWLLHTSVWHLPTTGLDPLPTVGEVIEDGSARRWIIQATEPTTFGARLRCPTWYLQLPTNGADMVHIEQATWSRGPAGEQLADWSILHAALPVLIVPRPAEPTTDNEQRRFAVTHDIYLTEPIDVNERHRLVDATGTTYKIAAYDPPATLAELPRLQCIRQAN